MRVQGRAGQGKVEKRSAGQDRAELRRAGLGRAGQGRAGQGSRGRLLHHKARAGGDTRVVRRSEGKDSKGARMLVKAMAAGAVAACIAGADLSFIGKRLI